MVSGEMALEPRASLVLPKLCFDSSLFLWQVPLFNILKKFDGEFVTEVVRPCIARMRYRVTRLPKYLILHMRRFTKNNFFIEKNPTLGIFFNDHLFNHVMHYLPKVFL